MSRVGCVHDTLKVKNRRSYIAVNNTAKPRPASAYTVSGEWGHLGHGWLATVGDWIFEAPGEARARGA
jgi:hypothetical protein